MSNILENKYPYIFNDIIYREKDIKYPQIKTDHSIISVKNTENETDEFEEYIRLKTKFEGK